MANQGPDRRTVLEMLGKAVIASQFTGFHRWAYGQQHEHGEQDTAKRVTRYEPAYFSKAEYGTIEALCDLIIPADASPGAREAGASEFIDFLAAQGEGEIREPMRTGLRWLDGAALSSYGGKFAALPAERQVELLERIAYQRGAQADDGEGRKFFALIRRYTVMGYYTSRVGLKELDYPGLRLYSKSPACRHGEDAEHLHLSSPGLSSGA